MSDKHIKNQVVVLDDRTHVLTVPSRYIGSITPSIREEYILAESGKFKKKEIKIVPAFITLLREVVSNSIDEFIRTNGDYANKIDISFDGEYFQVIDNGRGLPHGLAVNRDGEDVELPQSVVAFTQTKAGTNFKDKSSSIGMHGEGVSLVNIFAKHFIVETSDGEKKTFLECHDNMSDYYFKLTKNKKRFTNIKWKPDYQRLNIEPSQIGDDYIKYIQKVILDLSVCYPDIKFSFNKKKISANSFKDYVQKYGDVFEAFSFKNVDLAYFPSLDYEHIAWVNGINTRRGGTHVNFVINSTIQPIRELLRKKYSDIKPADIKNKICFIINIRNMEGPRFDSQTKQELINSPKDFERLFEDVDFEKIGKKVKVNKDIIENVIETFRIKEELKKRKALENTQKKLKPKAIAKLIETYRKDRENCRLYISEGKSATMNFLTCRDDNFAAYPLKGKFINSHDTTLSRLLKNAEVADILAATGLKLTSPSIENLRYGKIVIFTDADYDGDAICCLLINFFFKFWPNLFEEGRIFKSVTPLIIAKNLDTKEEKYFFTLNEYDKASKSGNWRMDSYNKGLGSLRNKEYKFSLDNLVQITMDETSEDILEMSFGKNAEARKKWLLES